MKLKTISHVVIQRPSPSLFISTIFLLAAVLPLPAVDSSLTYPGLAPGPVTLNLAKPSLSFSNAALAVTWEWGSPGIKRTGAYDVQTGKTLNLPGEVFVIVLKDGTRYPSSALRCVREPHLSALPPQANASRLAARLGGRQLEIPLRSEDNRVEASWRVLANDGANYAREEVEIASVTQALEVREVIWLQQVVAGATAAGRVDGSPVVAGNFFFGIEDPMAVNRIAAPEQKIGEWSPADLEAGQRKRKTWPVPTSILKPGTNTVVFRYDRGPHRLDVWRVALLENGREIAVDAHHGHTGTTHVNNSYQLDVPQVNPTASYEMAAALSTDPDFKVPPDQSVTSYGQVSVIAADGPVLCRLPRDLQLRRGERFTHSFVLGVTPAGQLRRGFLYYLERERAHPYRPFLHYNSWYDISWGGYPMDETNCLAAIREFGEQFIKPYNVVMDAIVFDDGWDDPKTLWKFHRGFPNGFAPHAELCRQYGTRLGVWLSPFGGYGDARDQRLKYGREQGYEINATGFSLAGRKYYAAFKDACVEMIRRYGANHFKFDGIASGMYADGSGADYIFDTEAMRRLMLELRPEDPRLYINLTTGSWPSPFWLRFADSVWRQGGDMGFSGKGNKQRQWLNYRDQEVYRNVVGKGPLYPLNALMTQGVAWSRQGPPADPAFDSAGFKEDVRAFFGAGTSLQELYIQPQRLGPDDWKVLAEAAQWSRANADVLVDTHWIGGDPSKSEVYGYASWTPRKGILMLRNPDDQSREFRLDIGQAFELPAGARRDFNLKSSWAEDAGKPTLNAAAGREVTLSLQPFEIVILEANPAE